MTEWPSGIDFLISVHDGYENMHEKMLYTQIQQSLWKGNKVEIISHLGTLLSDRLYNG